MPFVKTDASRISATRHNSHFSLKDFFFSYLIWWLPMTPLKKTTLFILVVTGMCIAGIGLILYLRSLETAVPDSTADQAEKQSDTPKQTDGSSVAAPDANAGAVTETGPELNNARAAIAATVVGILMSFVLLVIIKIKMRQRKAAALTRRASPSDPSPPVSSAKPPQSEPENTSPSDPSPPVSSAKPPQSEPENTSDWGWDPKAVPQQSLVKDPKAVPQQSLVKAAKKEVRVEFMQGDNVDWAPLRIDRYRQLLDRRGRPYDPKIEEQILQGVDVIVPAKINNIERLGHGITEIISNQGTRLSGYFSAKKDEATVEKEDAAELAEGLAH
jgi:hypothetical protein